MDWTFRIGDLALVFATIAGPILAIQAQKWVERGREQRQRRLWIFKTLMATRAARLAPNHVEALNAIPVEFYGSRGELKRITDAWKAYIDYTNPQGVPDEVWGPNLFDLFINLLELIAKFLGYDFNRVELKNEIYAPRAHGEAQTEQDIIRRGFARLFSGEIALPMDIKTFPTDPAVIQNQRDLQGQLKEWLKGELSVRVTMEPPPPR